MVAYINCITCSVILCRNIIKSIKLIDIMHFSTLQQYFIEQFSNIYILLSDFLWFFLLLPNRTKSLYNIHRLFIHNPCKSRPAYHRAIFYLHQHWLVQLARMVHRSSQIHHWLQTLHAPHYSLLIWASLYPNMSSRRFSPGKLLFSS